MLKKTILTIGLLSALALAACRPLEVPQPGGAAGATPTPGKDLGSGPSLILTDDSVTSTTPKGLDDQPPVSTGPADKPLPTADYAPQPGDSALTRDTAYVEQAEVLQLESLPVQYVVSLSGNLPTPCHQLRITTAPPDAQGKIMLEVYSVVDPNRVCAMVLKSFEANVPLGALPAGDYTLFVNGEQMAEFTQ